MSRNERESDGVGGAAVCVRLEPSDEVVAGRRRCVIAGPVSAGRRLLRVLVVDNDRDATDSLSILVCMWGHEVRRAYGGVAALEMAFAYQPDVVFLDIAMPQKNGCQVAWQLRQQATTKDARLIAITGYADEAHGLLCEYAGFDECLIKPVPPFVVEELLAREGKRLEESPETFRAARREYGPVVVGDSASEKNTSFTSSIGDRTAWQVWAIPVHGPRRLVESCGKKRDAWEAARRLNHATPWLFHDVRRAYVDDETKTLYAGDGLLHEPVVKTYTFDDSIRLLIEGEL